MKKTIALLLITLVTIQTTKAQENGQDEFGSWMMFFGNARLSDKISISPEVQYNPLKEDFSFLTSKEKDTDFVKTYVFDSETALNNNQMNCNIYEYAELKPNSEVKSGSIVSMFLEMANNSPEKPRRQSAMKASCGSRDRCPRLLEGQVPPQSE